MQLKFICVWEKHVFKMELLILGYLQLLEFAHPMLLRIGQLLVEWLEEIK